MIKKTLIAIGAFVSLQMYAGGYQVSLQGQRQIAMGHAATGLSLDGSSIFFNPGALSFTPKRNVNLGASIIMAKALYDASTSEYPSTYQARNLNKIGTPFSFYADFNTGEDDKWKVGLGVYTPYGSAVEYEEGWKGRFLLKSIDLKAICIQPTVSYRIGNFGIGAGFVYGIGSFKFERGVPLTTLGTDAEGNALLEGKASGMGFNIGVFGKLNDQWTVGINYRSLIKMKSKDGKADFTVPSAVGSLFPDTEVAAELPLPAVATLGVGYKATEKLQLAFDAQYTFWSVYDTLRFDYTSNTAGLTDTKSDRSYANSLTLRLGAEYNVNSKIDVRAGVVYDFAAADKYHMTPETPDANRFAPSVGLGIKPIENLTIDVSLLWVEGQKREIRNTESNFNGTYKLRALVPGLGLSYRF